jgi:DNA replication and repair protein RecF
MEMQKKSTSAFPAADLNLVGNIYHSAQEFQDALAASRTTDINAGRTLKGPHLSDLASVYSEKAIDAKNCSTGEQKALLISIIIATAKIQLELFNTPPILLFDEVSAHLDSKRRSLLYMELCDLGLQVFLTGTDISIFEELKTHAEFFKVQIDSNMTICTKVDDISF